MTKEYLLSKTNYGIDIIQHLIRKEYPEHIMIVSGTNCGECPDPVWADGSFIQVTIDRFPIQGQKVSNYKARYHYLDERLFDGDAIALAAAYYNQRGEQLTEDKLISRLAAELYIKEPWSPEKFKQQEVKIEKKPASPTLPPCPKMSFFRKPIKNTKPCRDASPQDIYKYLVSDYAKIHTEKIRSIADNKERSRYKAANLDYITPGGVFASRKECELIKASGYMVIDFDHIPNCRALVKKLANDERFETVLAFVSPSGDGVKWIVALPDVTKPDGTKLTYEEYFIMLSNYSKKVYGVIADPSGKDICRACFLPHDPEAFINPFYIETKLDYDITKFLY